MDNLLFTCMIKMTSRAGKIENFGRTTWGSKPEWFGSTRFITKFGKQTPTYKPSLKNKSCHNKVANYDHNKFDIKNKFTQMIKRLEKQYVYRNNEIKREIMGHGKKFMKKICFQNFTNMTICMTESLFIKVKFLLLIKSYNEYSIKKVHMGTFFEFKSVWNQHKFAINKKMILEMCFQKKNLQLITYLLDTCSFNFTTMVRYALKHNGIVIEENRLLSIHIIDKYINKIYDSDEVPQLYRLYNKFPNNKFIRQIIITNSKYNLILNNDKLPVLINNLVYGGYYLCLPILPNIMDIYINTYINTLDDPFDGIKKVATLCKKVSEKYCGVNKKFIKNIDTRIKFKENFGINIMHPNELNYDVVVLLLLVAKDRNFKRYGFKYIIRKIIEYYYSTY